MATNTITAERQEQLAAIYAEIKKVILDIEAKYSPDYRVVELDFPPTLGLEHLEYVRHTAEELQSIAEQQLAAKYAEKARVYTNRYNSSVRNLQASRSLNSAKHQNKLSDLLKTYQEELENLMHKLVNNGLLYSSVKKFSTQNLQSEYDSNVASATELYQSQDAAYADKLEKLTESHTSELADLQTQKSDEVAALVHTLSEKENKEALAIDKYNATIDEKENKYQANCIRYQQYAQQAENERALAVAKLYAEIGETGIAQQTKKEILAYCRSEFSQFSKSEADYIYAIDDFLQIHLGEYYSALVDWTNATLRT